MCRISRLFALTVLLAAVAATPRIVAQTVVKLVPIVLQAAGSGGSEYSTELTLANRGTTTASVELDYTPATSLGASGGGSVSLSLAARHQVVIPDTVAWLRDHGLPIPSSGNQGGTLRTTFSGLSSDDAAWAGARTITPSGTGFAGLGYPGMDLRDLPPPFSGPQLVYGLRRTSSDRSNLALVNASASPITLHVTLVSGTGGHTFEISPDTALDPGQWVQFNRVLDLAGFENGWALVGPPDEGQGPFIAYGVINDNTTNDGSFVPFETINSGGGWPARLVPVLVESSVYQSELVLMNPTSGPAPVTLTYLESNSPGGGPGGRVTVTLPPTSQEIIPNAIDFLRRSGISLGPKGAATYAGSLRIESSPVPTFAEVRTAAPAGGAGPGEYGLSYPSLFPGHAATADSWVFGLQQNDRNRSNLAVVNFGDVGGALSLRIDVYDGGTGQLAGSTLVPPILAGAWKQIDAVLQPFGVANGYAHVVRLSGSDRFLAYGVINDGATPTSGGTNDGSYVAMANH
jgi:hypothetical protein